MALLVAAVPAARADDSAPTPPASTAAPPAPKPPAAKPKPAPKPTKKRGSRGPTKRSRKPGEPGVPDEAVRRVIAGTPQPGGRSTKESAELRALRELDLQLFPRTTPGASTPWLAPGSPLVDRGAPRVLASGLAPDLALPPPVAAEPARDVSWLGQLAMPDIPVRWDARVVRYLEYYRSNPRGRSMVRGFLRRSGRYSAAIRKALREQHVPEDILWLALVESGFDPTIQSPAGAAGLWQFMPDGARIYGLTVDRWIDERLDPERSTVAAARYLSDLRQRFGSWELAFAAYNMGYGGLLSSIRKYNTNDFWELSRLEAGLPLETALYVPKILAMAIVAKNRAIFGCDDVELEPSVGFDKIAVGSGVSLRSIALASETNDASIVALNPQLVAGRLPPLPFEARQDVTWTVRVPSGKGARAAKSLEKVVEREPKLVRYRVRWGESLDDVAAARGVGKSAIAALNGLRRDEVVRPGALLFVPANEVAPQAGTRPTVVVPAERFVYADRHRFFYRVMHGDTLGDVAVALAVPAEDIRRWNALDPGARLHDGMTLQLFLAPAKKPANVVLASDRECRILAAGTPEFVAHFEALRGRERVEVAAKTGDTWKIVAKRYGLTLGQLERINHRARSTPLAAGDRFVVYVPAKKPETVLVTAAAHEVPSKEPTVVSPAGTSPKKDDRVEPAALRRPAEGPLR